MGLMDSLESTTRKLNWKPSGTEWGDYYTASSSHYSASAFEHKKQVVSKFLERIQPASHLGFGSKHGRVQPAGSQNGQLYGCL